MMRKVFVLLLSLNIALAMQGQAPAQINYQGIARKANGNEIDNEMISLRLTIRDGSAGGTIVYRERRNVITNSFGLFNVAIGGPGAMNVTGSMAAVNWGTGSKFLQVEMDPNGGSSFINMGTSQLLSVPYAFYAAGTGDLVLPFIKTQSAATPLFGLTNSGAGDAINGINTGTGRGGYFQVNNPASTADALRGETNGTGPSWAIRGISSGTNGAGLFIQSNPANTSNNLQSNQAGLGRAGLFNSNNAASTANAVDINVAGTGYALQAASTNVVPKALRTVGALQFTGIGEGPGKVLTSDAAGNATWVALPPSGSFALPFIANENSAVDLFTINNVGTGTSLVGTNASVISSISAIRGEVTSNAPGGFSSAVRGINHGTGGLGVGIWGSQGGSGWGVYGVTPNGLGVYGNATAVGYGVFGNSTSGIGIYGTSTDGFPGQFVISNNTNNNAALSANTLSDGVAIEGSTSSTTSSIAAIRGVVSSTSPGGFSSAIRGINNGTGGLGVGIWGSQAGSGWGVYGVTPTGLGVYGNSTGTGYGVFANSTSGIGLYATSTDGIAANFVITNNANNSNVVNANSLGNGTIINVSSLGSGKGVFASTGAGFAIHGVTSSISSAGIIGDNNAGGEAVVGRNNSDIAGAVVGRNDGGGYGVRGFVTTNATGTSVGVLGQVGLNNGMGRAGRFENLNATNNINNAFEVETNGGGNIPDRTQGNAANFLVDNSNSVAAAVRGQVNTIFGNFGAAAVFGESVGTGGAAGLFYQQNPAGNGNALLALTDGNGDAIRANAGLNGDAIEANVDGSGNAIYGWVPTFGTGRAARFNIFNTANTNPALTSTTVGNGNAGDFFVDNVNGTSAGVKGTINSQFSNFGTAAIYGRSDGTGGTAGQFYISNASSPRPAIIASTEGTGEGVFAVAGNGNGLEAISEGSGISVYGWSTTFSTGRAGVFVNFNDANTSPVLTVETHSNSNLAVFKAGDPATANVARIDATGRGFFNNGTQVGGADVAEMFDVNGNINEYEAGDILVISTIKDRAVEKSSEPYSTLVAGVYATKPGVILTEEHVDANLDNKVPMGVVGVIPTKVCMEGGAIKRGDLLVTSSIAGVAMKADPNKVKVGQVLGKALQDYNANGVGKINVLVNVK